MNKKAQAWIEELAPRVIVGDEATDEEWLAGRVGMMTGSKIPEVLGIGYNGPLDVMSEFKHPELVRPVELYSESWFRMKLGSLAEKPVLLKCQADRARPLGYQTIGCPGRLVRHPEYEWAACSPDGMAMCDEGNIRILIEAKFHAQVSMKRQYETDDGDECMPSKHRAQCLWNAAVLGADIAVLCVGFGDCSHLFRVIPLHKSDTEMMFAKAQMFLEAVTNDDSMALMGIIEDAEAMNEVIKEIFSNSTDTEISICDPELDSDIETLIDIKKQLKELESRKSGLEAVIKSRVGTARRMLTSRFRVTWGQGKGRDKFDRAGFAADNPNLAQKYTQAGLPYRTGLRMTPKKEK